MLDAFFYGVVCLTLSILSVVWHFNSESVSILFTECWENSFELFGNHVTAAL